MQKQWSSSSSSRPWQGRNQQNSPRQNHTKVRGLGGTPARRESALPRKRTGCFVKARLECLTRWRRNEFGTPRIGCGGVSYLNARGCFVLSVWTLSILWRLAPDGDLTEGASGFNFIYSVPLCVPILLDTVCHHLQILPYDKPIPFCECTLTHCGFGVRTVNSDKSKHWHYTLKGDKGFPRGGIFTFISPCRLRGLLLPSQSVDCFHIWYPLVLIYGLLYPPHIQKPPFYDYPNDDFQALGMDRKPRSFRISVLRQLECL